jgi:hypothetical protein
MCSNILQIEEKRTKFYTILDFVLNLESFSTNFTDYLSGFSNISDRSIFEHAVSMVDKRFDISHLKLRVNCRF